jgi:hypothetical protein
MRGLSVSMNYYEELGVDRSASAEQIRQAYRNLAKLLHPDQCNDGALRALAETQMRRLNQILEVLSDPQERLAYDLTLDSGPLVVHAAPAPVVSALVLGRRVRIPLDRSTLVWWGTGVVGAALLLALIGWTRPAAPEAAKAATPAKPAPAPSKAKRAARKMAPPIGSRALAARPAPPKAPLLPKPPADVVKPERAMAVAASGAPFGEVLLTPPPPPTPALSATPPAATAAPPQRAHRSRLSGTWLYAPEAIARRAKGMYHPEFIELRLIEEGGMLRGRYRSRYAVSDQAISPLVNFQFEGPAGAARLPWLGPNGAQGEVSLRLVSDSLLEVRWTARRLSQELTLTSGAATLIRDAQP